MKKSIISFNVHNINTLEIFIKNNNKKFRIHVYLSKQRRNTKLI